MTDAGRRPPPSPDADPATFDPSAGGPSANGASANGRRPPVGVAGTRPVPELAGYEPWPPRRRRRDGGATEGGDRWAGDAPRLRTLSEHQDDVVAVVSAEGRFVFVSASAERLLGYDVSAAVGRDALGLFDPGSVEEVQALFADLVAGRRLTLSLEVATVRADGRELELELEAANHLDDPIGGVVVVVRDLTERRRRERRLEEIDRRHDTLIESVADGLVMVDEQGTLVRVNEAFEVLFGVPRIRLLGRTLEELLAAAAEEGLAFFDQDGEPFDQGRHPLLVTVGRRRRTAGEVLGLRRDGGPVTWLRVNARAVIDPEGRVAGAVASVSDITESGRAAAEQRQEERFLQVLLDTLDEGIVACDADGRLTVFNPSARRLHGLDDDVDPVGRVPSSRMLRRPDGSPLDPEDNPLLRAMSGERIRDLEIVLVPEGAEPRKVSVNAQSLVDEGGWMLGAVVAMHDVTEQKRNEARLAELAHHDPLTALANRTLLAERLREAIDVLARATASPAEWAPGAHPGLAVYLLDLDEFKEINDALGHEVGDDLLVAVARRLAGTVRPADTVARLGGDEFVVVCAVEHGEEEMARIAERISSALDRPYRLGGRTLTVRASVGGVFVDDPDTDPSQLLSRADDAMYGVKWSRRRQRRAMTD